MRLITKLWSVNLTLLDEHTVRIHQIGVSTSYLSSKDLRRQKLIIKQE